MNADGVIASNRGASIHRHTIRRRDRLQFDVPIWKHGVFDYLESEGLRFCCDFGTENACEMARARWAARKHTTTMH